MPTPDFTPSNTPPDAHAVPSFAGTAEAPVGIAHPLGAPTASAPEAHASAFGEPTAAVPQIVQYTPIVPDPTDSAMHTATFYFNGKLTLAQIFGLYKAPSTVVLKGMQLAAQTPPQGASAIIELVDADGVGLGRTATLPAGQPYADVTFDPPLALAANTIVRAKVTAVGSTTNGGYLQATLVAQVIP